jgi:hypothetical protein
MIPTKYIASNLFHGTASAKDLMDNSSDLSIALGYNNHKTYQDFHGIVKQSQPESSRFYVEGTDYAHFYKSLLLGKGKREGLVIESKIGGRINKATKESIEKIPIIGLKFHGYGGLWRVSRVPSRLNQRIRERIEVPAYFMLRELKEEDMIKAVS